MAQNRKQESFITRRERPGYGVLATELEVFRVDGASSGQFKMQVEPTALHKPAKISTMSNAGAVNFAVAIDIPQKKVIVLIGDIQSNGHQIRQAFALPGTLPDGQDPHELDIQFAGWRITGVQLHGESLPEILLPDENQ